MKKWVLKHPYLSHIPTEDINTDVAMERIRTTTVEVDTGEDINTDVAMERIRTTTVEVDIMKDRTESIHCSKIVCLEHPRKKALLESSTLALSYT
jgi:hypothetical protein